MFLQNRFETRAPFKVVLAVLALILVGMVMGGALVAGAARAQAAEVSAGGEAPAEIAHHRRSLRLCLPLFGHACHPHPHAPRRLRPFR